MRMRIFLTALLIVLLIPLIFAVTGNSSSYTITGKMDSGATANANSSSYNNRFVSGEQPVAEYNSSTYTGRFGVLTITSDDITAPAITLTSPADAFSTTLTAINFQYTVSDSSATNCSLVFDGSITNHEASINITGGTNTFAETGLSVAAHTWGVNCTDASNNSANSSTRALTITADEGGGGGGGGGGESTTLAVDFDLSEYSYETTLSVSDSAYGDVDITNNENFQKSFNVGVNAPLEGIIFLKENIITLNAGETKPIEFTITAPEDPGVYAGKISVETGGTTKDILFTLNVKTETSLFDVGVVIPSKLKKINIGDNLEAQIDLLQAGIKEKMDVTLNYVIKDFDGVIHFEESETVMVYDKKSLSKEFHTAELPLGDYVLGIELIYPNGVAVASSQFKVADRYAFIKDNVTLIVLIAVILVLVILIKIVLSHHKFLKVLGYRRQS